MNELKKLFKEGILPKTREDAVYITKNYDNSEFVRENFELRKNIKNRSYCRFFKICKGFYLNHETCIHSGGEYCGKFRHFLYVENKIINKKANKTDIITSKLEELKHLTEQQKDSLRKNKNFNVIPLQAWDVVIPLITKERKVCSKCGKEVFMPFYVERKRLFRSKTKKWCFSCYNKLKHGAGKLKLTDVVITGAKDDSILGEKIGEMFIGDNIIMPSIPPIRIPIEDVTHDSYTKLSDIGEERVDCIHSSILKSVNNHYACKHIDNKSKICNDNDCPIKMKLSTVKNYLATEKEITVDDVQFQICKDKDSKSLKEMKAECYKCGRNIGFNNIPSEICYECSIYDIEKPDNKFKSIKRDEK